MPDTAGMRLRRLARIAAIFLLLAYSLGAPMIAMPLASAASMQMPDCDSCGDVSMPASQCAAVCAMVYFSSAGLVSPVPPVHVSLRPISAEIPAGWSNPPDTAPPRV